jgi:hypothetical protein
MPHLAEPGQSLDIDVDQLTGPLLFVVLHRRFALQPAQASETQFAESPGDDGEGCLQQPGDVLWVQALLPEIDSLLQLLWIARPPLGVAHTASIRQRGLTAGAATGELAVGTAQVDADLGDESRKVAVVLQVLGHQPEKSLCVRRALSLCMSA